MTLEASHTLNNLKQLYRENLEGHIGHTSKTSYVTQKRCRRRDLVSANVSGSTSKARKETLQEYLLFFTMDK